MRVSNFLFYLTLMAGIAAAGQTRKPNVIIVYGDDVGYSDVGAYGAKLIPTPNIDKLASEGLLLRDGHCSASTCSPSRYSLLTGNFAFRKGIRILPGDAKMCIDTDELTLPKVFKRAGYTTGVIGKWHLGLGDGKEPIDWNSDVKPGPLEIGFDSSFLLPATNDRVPCVYLKGHRVVGLDKNDPITVDYRSPLTATYPDGKKNPEAMTYYRSSHGHNNSVINGIGRIGYMSGGKAALWDDETMADVLADKARRFIEKNKDKPFFLYFASQDIHVPRVPHPRFRGKTKLGYRGDVMVQLDWTCGEIMKALEKHGLTENTMVIFASDNGPVWDDGYRDGSKGYQYRQESNDGHDASGPYRGGKYMIQEGGTRVPFIVRWPAGIKPGVSDALFSQVDLLGSFASMLDIPLSATEAIDSRDALSTLLGKDEKGSDFIVTESWGLAIRKGNWKYIHKGKKELYDLGKDIMEKNNVADQHPELISEFADLIKKAKSKQGLRASYSDETSATSKRPADATEFKGRYYKVIEERGTWAEADAKCRAMGGMLAAIKSKEVDAFIAKLTSKKCYWIGGNDKKKEGDWRWPDGSKVEYSNWGGKEPDNWKNKEHVMVYSWWGKGQMADTNEHYDGKGGRIRGFICEWGQ